MTKRNAVFARIKQGSSGMPCQQELEFGIGDAQFEFQPESR
jgi:hypothetical protein